MKVKQILISLFLIITVIFSLTLKKYNMILIDQNNYKAIKNNKLIYEKILVLNNNLEHSKNFILFLNNSQLLKSYTTNQISNDEFTNTLINIIKFSEEYSQVRILSKAGYEKFRINKEDNIIKVISSNELQDKSERYYYKELKKIPINKIWISKFDPNIENDIVETPINPTIRIGIKLKNEEFLIINLSLREKLNQIKNSVFLEDGKTFFIESNSGVWKINKDEILYSENETSKNFYIIGYIKELKQLKTLNEAILFSAFISQIKLFILIIFIIILISHFIYKKLNKKYSLAYIDSLTSCYNRNFFEEKTEYFNSLISWNVCYIDINKLKLLNDKYGHRYGDILIKKISQELLTEFEKDSYIIRMGGDEFIIFSNILESDFQEKIIKIYDKLSIKKIKSESISFSYGFGKEESIQGSLLVAEDRMYMMKKNTAYQKIS